MSKAAIPVIAYMAVHNGADFVRQAIESTIAAVDRFVVIEGAWGENVAVNGQPRSTDGTIEIIQELQEQYGKIDLWQHNDANQLAQRNRVFDHIPDDCWLFIQDHDEVWDPENLSQLWMLLQRTSSEAVKVKSFTFINDPYTYSPIAFPRCFRIRPGVRYRFCDPNHLVAGQRIVPVTPHEEISFFHYSYCHNPERFLEKKRERTHLHGRFPWDLEGDRVVRPEATVRFYDGPHPREMRDHPLMKVTPQRNGDHYVLIQHSGIGNLVHTTPLMRALRERDPRARLTVLTWPRSARILEGWPVVDEVVCDSPAGYYGRLAGRVKLTMISPVGALPLTPSVTEKSDDIWKLEFRAPWTKHEVEYHMDFARALGWEGETPESAVHVTPANREKVRDFLLDELIPEPFLVVNASYLKTDHWPRKHWGNVRYAEFLAEFTARHEWPVIFVGAKADSRDAQDIMRLTERWIGPVQDFHNLCGWSDDIKDTAALLERAALVVGNDGGLQHVAAAVGTPTVTVFTFTNHVKNAPRGDDARVVMIECAKRPMCQHNNHQNCQCLDVPVTDVTAAAEELLSRL